MLPMVAGAVVPVYSLKEECIGDGADNLTLVLDRKTLVHTCTHTRMHTRTGCPPVRPSLCMHTCARMRKHKGGKGAKNEMGMVRIGCTRRTG